MHNVVFEYNKKAGAYAGVRYCRPYQNKEEFLKLLPLSDDDTRCVLAQGITEDEAVNLTSQTPEICHLMVAVQEMCYREDGTINLKIADRCVDIALKGIELHRVIRMLNSLPVNRNVPEYEIGEEDTKKNNLLRFILESFHPNSDGSLGILGFIRLEFNLYFPLVAIKRLSAKLPSDTPLE